ncbi:hypothetical protein D9615_008861 [Tricholomella constricta]|uniref:Mucoidy inhibitor A n=1 Tax=Tricholomella constricta TaxID=117010 RepID=A0A8H5GZX4_9AGAR|nr:hypothetical protein D9615_008861 [Tricholomella constricta]
MQPVTAEHPPPFQPTNEIELVSTESSKIIGVSVYNGRAEITRLFKFEVRKGQNQVTINGLPTVLDQDSLRIEGRGTAIIHDVTISRIFHPRRVPVTSPALSALLSKKDEIAKALERCKKSISSLESYLATMHIQHIDMSQIGKVLTEYDATAEKLDKRMLYLEKELAAVEKEIGDERKNLSAKAHNEQLNIRTVIGIFAEIEGEVEIALIYALYGASWKAGYDIRVDMQAKEAQVALIYKAAIAQNTGEDWNDVSLMLETVTPTFGVSVPTLDPWNLSIYKPHSGVPPSIPHPQIDDVSTSRKRRTSRNALTAPAAPPVLAHRATEVSSKENVSATFKVPGLITIPSDGVAHNVTIVQLQLDAKLSWVCVPKKDTKVHLSAKIKNASQYTLLRGTGSVYVDGSFLSRSVIPPVSPDESFDCPLGLDPSIRVTYHPELKKQSKSGFYNKTANHVFSQHITVFNTKAMHIDGVKILDQIPVSEDAQIQVNLINPPLTRPIPSADSASTSSSLVPDSARKPITVTKGVTASWDGAEELDTDGERVGKDGKINWVCSIPPQGNVNLVLQWEVVVPARADVVGLMLAICYP